LNDFKTELILQAKAQIEKQKHEAH
jgi:hypothetical protein